MARTRIAVLMSAAARLLAAAPPNSASTVSLAYRSGVTDFQNGSSFTRVRAREVDTRSMMPPSTFRLSLVGSAASGTFATVRLSQREFKMYAENGRKNSKSEIHFPCSTPSGLAGKGGNGLRRRILMPASSRPRASARTGAA